MCASLLLNTAALSLLVPLEAAGGIAALVWRAPSLLRRQGGTAPPCLPPQPTLQSEEHTPSDQVQGRVAQHHQVCPLTRLFNLRSTRPRIRGKARVTKENEQKQQTEKVQTAHESDLYTEDYAPPNLNTEHTRRVGPTSVCAILPCPCHVLARQHKQIDTQANRTHNIRQKENID